LPEIEIFITCPLVAIWSIVGSIWRLASFSERNGHLFSADIYFLEIIYYYNLQYLLLQFAITLPDSISNIK
jgi:hypothetical protein